MDSRMRRGQDRRQAYRDVPLVSRQGRRRRQPSAPLKDRVPIVKPAQAWAIARDP
jgi:hypothetical protein